MAKAGQRRFTITYPPTYDGELWIYLTDIIDSTNHEERSAVQVTCTVAAPYAVSDLEILEMLAKDLQTEIERHKGKTENGKATT